MSARGNLDIASDLLTMREAVKMHLGEGTRMAAVLAEAAERLVQIAVANTLAASPPERGQNPMMIPLDAFDDPKVVPLMPGPLGPGRSL